MLRINLLPAYIAERRKTQAAIAISAILLVLPCIGLLIFYGSLKTVRAQKEQDATDAEAAKAAVDAIVSQASQTRAKIAPLQDKVHFVEDVRFYNTLRPRIYTQAARYTIPRVEYNAMSVTGNALTIGGFVSGENGKEAVQNFGRYLITFFGNPDITALSVAGLPGYPSPATGTGTANGGAGSSGFPGGSPFGNRGFGPQSSDGPGGGPGFGPPGGFGGGGQSGQDVGPNGEALPPRIGFSFTSTATLKHAVTPPALPASLGGGSATGGGPGEFGPGGPPPGAPVDAGPGVTPPAP